MAIHVVDDVVGNFEEGDVVAVVGGQYVQGPIIRFEDGCAYIQAGSQVVRADVLDLILVQ